MFKKILKIVSALIITALTVALAVNLFPLVLSLKDESGRESFRAVIDSLGPIGILLMLLLQTAQIIVAIVPGEPIELLLGMMYGTVGGLLVSLLGIAIGQTAVFLLVKRYGISFAMRFVNVKEFEKLKFLQAPEKRDSLVFLLFFIPGTPKDILTYFAPFTGIPYLRFLILSLFARIPSVVSSTWAGSSISDGAFIKTLVIFALTGILGLAGILINARITKKHNS